MMFREATVGDAEHLLSFGHDRSELAKLLPKGRSSPRRSHLTLLAVHGSGTPLGSTTGIRIRGAKRAWLVGYTRVAAAARGRGIGTSLTAERDRRLTQWGVRATFTAVQPSNAASLAMIRRNGYRPAAWKTSVHPGVGPIGAVVTLPLHTVHSRPVLRAIGTLAGFRGLAVSVATLRRPLGFFPPYWPFPHHDWRRLTGRDPGVLICGGAERTSEPVAVVWHDTVVLSGRATESEIGGVLALVRDVDGSPATIYGIDRPPVESAWIADQWMIAGRFG